MSRAEDLSPWSDPVLGIEGLAVGWLDAERPFGRGQVTATEFGRLAALLRDPWQPAVAAGRHTCPFCLFTGGPASVVWEGRSILLGTNNLFVPAEVLYVAPSLILHYVDAHMYRPPEVFLDAVARCPPMRSMDYLRGLRDLGVRGKRVG